MHNKEKSYDHEGCLTSVFNGNTSFEAPESRKTSPERGFVFNQYSSEITSRKKLELQNVSICLGCLSNLDVKID